MSTAFLATTFPSPPRPLPAPPEPPLTWLQWACVAWIVWPVLLVLVLAWSVSGRRGAAARRRTLAFNLVAAVSCMSLAATAAVYASGHQGSLDPLGWPKEPITRTRLTASAQDGTLYLGVMTPPVESPSVSRVRFGFGYLRTGAWSQTPRGLVRVGTVRELVAPAWAVLFLSALAPAAWLARAAALRRTRRPGLCRRCGYDLRATPGRCPECGAVPEAVKA